MSKFLGLAMVGGAAFYGYRYFVDQGKRLNGDQHVVIIGGGYGGARVGTRLNNRGKFTLIDEKEALHHNMAALRAAVEPGFSNKTFIPYRQTFQDSFVRGKVVDIDTVNKTVTLENQKEPIHYTQLVIATGSTGPFPGKCRHDLELPDILKLYEDFAQEVKKAKKVVIIGGGAVGVEMAGEIAAYYPDQKQITVVHMGDVLVSSLLAPKATKKLAEKLDERKVNVVYGSKVSNLNELPTLKTTEGLIVKTSNSKEIEADLVIPCYGLTINKGAYLSSLGDRVNEKGQLRVNKNLEVIGTDGVFAIGDCNDFDVLKLALEAQAQASHTFENLVNIGKEKPLEPYVSDTMRMVVPIGRDGGITQYGKRVFGDFLTKTIKAKDVFVKIMWKGMSQPVPKD